MEWTTVLTAVLGLVLAGVVAVVGAVWNLRSFVEKRLSAATESMREESRRVEKEAKEDRRRVEKEAKEDRRRVEKEAKEDRRRVEREAKEDRRRIEREAKEERGEIKAEMERRLMEAKEDRREIRAEMNRRLDAVEVRIGRLEAPYFRRGVAEDGEEEADDGFPGGSSGPSSSQPPMAAKGG